jgi:hypothetical protein
METKVEKDYTPVCPISRINLGAIIGGAIIGMFFQMLFSLLGLAIGITALQPGQPITLGMGIGGGIYLIIITALSVFIGAFAAGRFAGFVSRYDGLFHGVATLALLTILSLFTVSTPLYSPMVSNTVASNVQTNQIPNTVTQKINEPTGAASPLSPQQDRIATGTIWSIFFTALLSLIAAGLGGVAGLKSRVRSMGNYGQTY